MKTKTLSLSMTLAALIAASTVPAEAAGLVSWRATDYSNGFTTSGTFTTADTPFDGISPGSYPPGYYLLTSFTVDNNSFNGISLPGGTTTTFFPGAAYNFSGFRSAAYSDNAGGIQAGNTIFNNFGAFIVLGAPPLQGPSARYLQYLPSGGSVSGFTAFLTFTTITLPTNVPEPSSVFGLLGFGTIGGFAFIRRRISSKKTTIS
jgi:PEP-CTERM motif